MANKPIETYRIESDGLLKRMKEKGYSIETLADKTNWGSRSIRYYLEQEEMPKKLLEQIDDVLRPKTNEIWMTLRVKVKIHDDELMGLLNRVAYEAHGFRLMRGGIALNERDAEDILRLGRDISAKGGWINMEDYKPYEEWYWQKIDERQKGDKNG